MSALGTDRVLKSWLLWNRYTEYLPLESPALSLEYLYAKKFCCFQINFAYHGLLEIPLSFGEPRKPIVYHLRIKEAAEGTDCSMAMAIHDP